MTEPIANPELITAPWLPNWPREWPSVEFIPRRTALRVVASFLNRRRFPTETDYQLGLLLARLYPWPFPSRQTMADRLGLTLSGLDKRLGKLERRLVIASYYSPPSSREYRLGTFTDARTLRLLTLPGLHWDPKLAKDLPRCEGCDGLLLPGSDPRKRFHNERCRSRHRRRSTAN